MNDNDDTVIADDETTGQRAHEVIMMLTGEFERITEAGELTVNRDTRHLFMAVFGWWVGINRSSQLVALAHSKQLGHESGPIVRSIIQHTLVLADLCIAYDARKLYVSYRLLSAQIHPSPQGGMAYIDDAGILSNHAAKQTWGLLIQTAMCLIQAARTINPLLKEQPLSDMIARAETRLGSEIGLWARRQKPTNRTARHPPNTPEQPPQDV